MCFCSSLAGLADLGLLAIRTACVHVTCVHALCSFVVWEALPDSLWSLQSSNFKKKEEENLSHFHCVNKIVIYMCACTTINILTIHMTFS